MRLRLFVTACLAVVVLGTVLQFESVTAVQPQVTPQQLPADLPRAPMIEDLGDAYHQTDAHVVRQTTWFPDATAVTEKEADGQIRSRLMGSDGMEMVRLQLPGNGAAMELVAPQKSGLVRQALDNPVKREASDWPNRQVYELWQNPTAGQPTTQDLLPGKRAVRKPLPVDYLDGWIWQIKTEFADGMWAITTLGTDAQTAKGLLPEISRDRIFTTSLFNQTGQMIGQAWYLEEKMAFAWSLPGISQGSIDDYRMVRPMDGQPVRGWSFNPNKAWANIQIRDFYLEYLRRSAQPAAPPQAPALKGMMGQMDPAAAGVPSCAVGKPPAWANAPGNLWSMLRGMFMPTLYANDVGCDYLHHLDGSMLRRCCDMHDRCYEREDPNCTIASWWSAEGWDCQRCNIMAVGCFFTTTVIFGCHVDPWAPCYWWQAGGGGGGGCGSDGGICQQYPMACCEH